MRSFSFDLPLLTTSLREAAKRQSCLIEILRWKLADAVPLGLSPTVLSRKGSWAAAEDSKVVLRDTIMGQGGMSGKTNYRNDLKTKASARSSKTTTSRF